MPPRYRLEDKVPTLIASMPRKHLLGELPVMIEYAAGAAPRNGSLIRRWRRDPRG